MSIVLGLCVAPAWGQSLDEVIEASKRGDHEAAVRGLEALAEKDHASALFSLGFIHYEGLVVPKNYDESAQSGFAKPQRKTSPARNITSDSCTTQVGVFPKTTQKHRVVSARRHRRAKPTRNTTSDSCTPREKAYPKTTQKHSSGFAKRRRRATPTYNTYLGATCTSRRPRRSKRLRESVLKWFRLAAQKGDVSAEYSLGLMYYKGWGIPKDDALAYKWFRLAAQKTIRARNITSPAGVYPKTTQKLSSWFRKRKKGHDNSTLESCTTKHGAFPKTTRKHLSVRLAAEATSGASCPKEKAYELRKSTQVVSSGGGERLRPSAIQPRTYTLQWPSCPQR